MVIVGHRFGKIGAQLFFPAFQHGVFPSVDLLRHTVLQAVAFGLDAGMFGVDLAEDVFFTD